MYRDGFDVKVWHRGSRQSPHIPDAPPVGDLSFTGATEKIQG